jgi:hypothetical protein
VIVHTNRCCQICLGTLNCVGITWKLAKGKKNFTTKFNSTLQIC